MIDELDLVPVDGLARQPLDCRSGPVAFERTFSEDTQCQTVLMLLRKRDESGIAEHFIIVRHFDFRVRVPILLLCRFA
jgi:hypothetical protein